MTRPDAEEERIGAAQAAMWWHNPPVSARVLEYER